MSGGDGGLEEGGEVVGGREAGGGGVEGGALHVAENAVPDAYLGRGVSELRKGRRERGGGRGETNMPHEGEVLIVGEDDNQGEYAGVIPWPREKACDEGLTLPCADGEGGCQYGGDAS